MNATLITLNVPNKIKDDFYTVCKVNQSSMTSEIVRFMNHFISEEVEKFKQNRVNTKEINEFKQRISSVPPTTFHSFCILKRNNKPI